MAYEKLQSLIEKLNVYGVKGYRLGVVPTPIYKGDYDSVEVMVMADDKEYIISIVDGFNHHFGHKPEIKSEVRLTTPQEFFRPTKPQQYFHYINLSKEDLLKLCEKFNVPFEEIKEEYRPKINNNYSYKEFNSRPTF